MSEDERAMRDTLMSQISNVEYYVNATRESIVLYPDDLDSDIKRKLLIILSRMSHEITEAYELL